MEGREEWEPGHVRRRRGLPGENSRVLWRIPPMELAWEMRYETAEE